MKQLVFGFTEFERFEADELNVFLLGSPEYEKKVEDKIDYILSDGSKKTVSRFDKAVNIRGKWFKDVPENIHLKTIRQIPHVLRADDININIASRDDIEKKLLEKDGKIYLVACYRLWCETEEMRCIIYTNEYQIVVSACGWKGEMMWGRVALYKIASTTNENCSHEILMTKDLKVSYPRKEFEHNDVSWQISFNEFSNVMQAEKRVLLELMVKLDIEIPKVK